VRRILFLVVVVVVAVGAFVALQRLHASMPAVIGGCAVLGVLARFAGWTP